MPMKRIKRIQFLCKHHSNPTVLYLQYPQVIARSFMNQWEACSQVAFVYW